VIPSTNSKYWQKNAVFLPVILQSTFHPLPGHDYSLQGAYFIIILSWKRREMFGRILDGEIALNEFREIAFAKWFESADHRRFICFDRRKSVVMPNHIHGIIRINDIETDPCSGAAMLHPYSQSDPLLSHIGSMWFDIIAV
jgi:hypothetical protein